MKRPERRFLFKLALALGKTVAELGSTLTSRDVTEWQAYEKVVGAFGFERDDMRAAYIAAATHGGEVTDYMPYYEPPPQSVKDMVLIGKSLADNVGDADKRT